MLKSWAIYIELRQFVPKQKCASKPTQESLFYRFRWFNVKKK